jgi:hypothetical protein
MKRWSLPCILIAMTGSACIEHHHSPAESPDPYATRAYESQDFDAQEYGQVPSAGPGYSESSAGYYGAGANGAPEEHHAAEPSAGKGHRPATPDR